MKKILYILAAASVSTATFAQKANIQSASNSLKFKEYKEAIEYIEKAVNDPSTKDDPKAWLVRGNIYSAMDSDPGYKDKGYNKEALISYAKVAKLKPTYEKEAVMSGLDNAITKAYNNSVIAYQQKSWTAAYENAAQVASAYEMNGGKLFAGNKRIDTLASGAMLIQAYSSFYNNQPDQALPILEKLKNNPIEGNANVYMTMIDAYRKKGDNAKELAIIEEARKRYPTNTDIRNEELNYYILTKQEDKLLKKFEDAAAAEPQNAVYQHNLANTYSSMAFPKGNDGKPLPKPANFKELIDKAEAGFDKAISLNPDNLGYHYDIGALQVNLAGNITKQANDLPTAEEAKYTELIKERDVLFAKAQVHLDKVYSALDPQSSNLDADNKFMYKSTLIALREIYAKQNKMDKAAEMKKKFEAVK